MVKETFKTNNMTEWLYKKDSKGEILKWSAEVNQNAFGVEIILKAGQYNGKIVTTIREDIKGKNIGKENETSPLTQAENEVKSLYKRKKRQGYKSLSDLKYDNNDAFGTIDLEQWLKDNLSFTTTDLDGNVKPMKAQQYYRSKKDWTDPTGKVWSDRKYYHLLNPYAPYKKDAIIAKFPVLLQPKINGVRCTVSLDSDGNIQILSKEGLKYNLPHLEKDIKEYLPFEASFNNNIIDLVYDGELWIPDEKLQVISSAVKAENLNTFRIQFIVFDLAIPNVKNIDRILKLKDLLAYAKTNLNSSIKQILTLKVLNNERVQYFTDEYINQGYEGVILRDPNAMYAFGKRPQTMTKLKRVIDEEFEIVNITTQDKRPDLGLFICKTKDGQEFEVNPSGSEADKEIILYQKHKYIGKMLTCTFYEYTEAGKPFHIIDNIIRDYE